MMASEVPSAPTDQDDQIAIGTWINSFYQVEAFLGQGTFGKVARCSKMDDKTTVAIKMIKNQGFYAKQAQQEVEALIKLRSLDPDKCNIVRWYQVFTSPGHICLAFEHLDKSLYDFMKERYFQPLLLKEIRPIVQQLAIALKHLRTVGIIHADLKTRNIMLVNHAQEPYKVKLIDFGIACGVSSAVVGTYTQTRPYRAPEIILGLPFTEAIDMWSLGCMAAFLYLGYLPYPGMNEYDMMRYIVHTHGQPPEHMLNSGQYTSHFFQRLYNTTSTVWELKTPEQFHQETGIQPKDTRRKLSSFNDLLHMQVINHQLFSPDRAAEKSDLLMFVDMLKAMLQFDPANRIRPRQVLEHPFIRMSHLMGLYPISSHVRSCAGLMIYDSKITASDSRRAECGSQPQPPSRTAQPIHPPPAAGSSGVQPHCTNPSPCTSTQTTSDKSGVKRKIDGEDKRAHHLPKKVKCDHQPSRAAPANSSAQASTASTSHCSQTQSTARSGTKRKTAEWQDTESQRTTSDRSDGYHEDRKRSRQTSPRPSTSSYTQRSDNERQGDTKYPAASSRNHSALYDWSNQRRSSAEPHCYSAHTSSSTLTNSQTWSGQKRKAADEEDVQLRKRPTGYGSDDTRRRSAVCSEEDRRRRGYDNERRKERQYSRDSQRPWQESSQRSPHRR